MEILYLWGTIADWWDRKRLLYMLWLIGLTAFNQVGINLIALLTILWVGRSAFHVISCSISQFSVCEGLVCHLVILLGLLAWQLLLWIWFVWRQQCHLYHQRRFQILLSLFPVCVLLLFKCTDWLCLTWNYFTSIVYLLYSDPHTKHHMYVCLPLI